MKIENKNNNKIAYLLYIIFILVFIILVFYIRKVIIFNTISNKLSAYQNSENYYIRMYEYLGHDVNTTQIWVKDNNLVKVFNKLPDTIIKNDIIYNFIDGSLSQVNENATNENIDDVFGWPWSFMYYLSNDLKSPINVFKYSLDEATVNGKKCYKIEYFNEFGTICYFDKETGLLSRYETLVGERTYISDNEIEIQSTLIDFKFEFNNVTNEDLEIYDLSNN